jgi:dCMP deaminase
MSRPSKDQYYLNIAKEVAQRGTCFRAKYGAIIVRDDQIVSAGYVGAPRGTKDCLERGYCLRDEFKIPHGTQYEACRSVHAEANAIINAARAGVNLLNGTLYLYSENGKTGERVDAMPCYICKKMIINAGLSKFVGSSYDGFLRVFHVEDWVAEWKQGDILDDKYQYGRDQNIKENLASADQIRNNFQSQNQGPKEFKSLKEVLMEEGKIEGFNKVEEA